MKRIDIEYGGRLYSIGGRELVDVLKEVEDGVASGGATWMKVNDGEGEPRDALLLITPGVPFAVIPVPAPEEGEDEDSVPPGLA